MKDKIAQIFFGLLAMFGFFGVANAQSTAVDVTSVVSSIGDQAAPVALIGGAVLVLLVGIKAFKWVRKAMS